MTILRTPRFWLMTTAALILSAGAQAQLPYQSGAPTMVAAAPGFPSIPAEQIARDITEEFNPRTGQKELVAAPFDPFEEDPALAGSIRLRSANGAVAIDGQPLSNGVILEADFYYNSPSDDPFEGRGYGDASFINGELAPVVLRDSRILECSRRVENVVYNHASYYERPYLRGLYRPYRHYTGHFAFGYGFGRNYFGPGYRHYGRHYSRHRDYGSRSHRSRGYRGHGTSGYRTRDDRRRARGEDRNRDRDSRDRNRDQSRDRGSARREADRVRNREQARDRMRRIESYGSETPRGESRNRRSNTRRNNTPMRGVNPEPRFENNPASSRSESRRNTRPESRRSEPRRSAPRVETRSEPRRAEPRRETRSQPRRAEPRRSAPRVETRSEPRRAEPRRETRSQPRRSETRRSTPKRPESRRSGPTARRQNSDRGINRTRRQLDFFPRDDRGYGGRNVVTSQSIDCAREDKLRVFISNARLEAARFDGLSVIALDSQGGETPIYIPPNYIEGYRLAASGQVRPQGYKTAPSSVSPSVVTEPNRVIESAPCPTGTSKQADGTCLQTGTTGVISSYPRQ